MIRIILSIWLPLIEFPDFSLTRVKFPIPTQLITLHTNPDSGFQFPLTAILSTQNFYVYQSKPFMFVKCTKEFKMLEKNENRENK